MWRPDQATRAGKHHSVARVVVVALMVWLALMTLGLSLLVLIG